MLGKSCKVTIVHRETDDGQTSANIASFKALKQGTAPPRVDSDLIFFSLDPNDAPDLKSLQKDFDALPESEQTKIAASPTWKELFATRQFAKAVKGKKASAIVNDSLPGQDDGFPVDF